MTRIANNGVPVGISPEPFYAESRNGFKLAFRYARKSQRVRCNLLDKITRSRSLTMEEKVWVKVALMGLPCVRMELHCSTPRLARAVEIACGWVSN